MLLVKNENTTLVNKGLLDLTTVTADNYLNSPFYKNFLQIYSSSGIISTSATLRFRILGSNTFQNIWLIDRMTSMTGTLREGALF